MVIYCTHHLAAGTFNVPLIESLRLQGGYNFFFYENNFVLKLTINIICFQY